MTLRLTTMLVAMVLACAGCGIKQTTIEPVSSSAATGESGVHQRRARIHTELAAGYYYRGQHEIALEELNEALKADPNYAMAHSVKGLVFMELKEDALAQTSLQKAVDIAPQDPEVRNNYGWFLCQRSREKQSLEQFDEAVRNPLYRTPELALVNAGNCSAKIGEIRRAETYFRQALTIQPLNINAHYGLADIAYKTAKYEEARNHLKGVMQTATPTAAGLLLGVCVERKLRDRQAELSYVQQLRNRFAESKEHKQLQSGAACD